MPVRADEGGLSSAIKRTGLPVPRWASLRTGEVNMRTGPGTRYPVVWVYRRKGLPVEIIAEFDTWRRIRDSSGDIGWVHQAALSGKRSVLVAGKGMQDLLRNKVEGEKPRAKVEPGAQAQLVKCDEIWCKVEINDLHGYMKRSMLWGIYPTEKVE